MSHRTIHWNEARDLTIRRMRAEGATWDAIALAIGVSRYTAIERGRKIGARRPPPEFRPQAEDPNREPLAAGHPRSWGVLIQGTVLEGVPYPLPVFDR